MSSPAPGELRFGSAHLRSLAAMHADAAAQVAQATTLTDGVGGSILTSHGVACLSSSRAAEKTAAARRSACAAIESMSLAHEYNLNSAAAKYTATDEECRDSIDSQMRPL